MIFNEDGRMVKCVSCAHEWFQEPVQDPYVSEPEEPNEPEMPEMDEYEGGEDDMDADAFDEAALEALINGTMDDEESGVEEEPIEDSDDFEDEDDSEEVSSAQEKPLEDIIREISSGDSDEDDAPSSDATQDPDEELSIPQGVKPIQEGEEEGGAQADGDSEGKEKTSKKKKKKKSKAPKSSKQPKPPRQEEPMMARLMGFAAAVVLFGVLFVGAIIAKPQILSAWPASVAIYELAGFPVSLKGEGVMIETLSAEISDQNQLILKGSLVNLKEEDVVVPPMRASFKLVDTDDSEKWIITPPQEIIAAGDSMEFTAIYDSAPDDISMVNVTFDTAF